MSQAFRGFTCSTERNVQLGSRVSKCSNAFKRQSLVQEPGQQCVKSPFITLPVMSKAVWEGPVCFVVAFPRSSYHMVGSTPMSSRRLKATGEHTLQDRHSVDLHERISENFRSPRLGY